MARINVDFMDFICVNFETNKILKSAISLYKKLGFKDLTTKNCSPYSRCDVQMELFLD